MELRQIRFAVAVAEDRHFGRAAERMFIAQPALSQHVRRLERELGAPLFDRGPRHVRMTPAGEAFLPMARQILQRADEAAAAARRAGTGETGSVSIGASLPTTAPLLSLLLRRWASARPEVRSRVVSGYDRQLVDLVRRRELDVVLVEGSPAGAGLRCVTALDDPMVVLLPSHDVLARQTSLAVDDLRDATFVTVSRDRSLVLHDRLVALTTTAGFTPRVALEVDDPNLLAVAVGGGLGLAVVPRVLALATGQPGLTWLPLVDAGSGVPLTAVAADEGATPQATALLDLLAQLRDRGAIVPALGRHLQLARRVGDEAAS